MFNLSIKVVVDVPGGDERSKSGSVVLGHPAAAMVMRVLLAEKGISL
ncbi:MAG: hypothetical protein ACOVOZ_07430 [Burkholderiaceae bacterium]|jgi:hypothetical protein